MLQRIAQWLALTTTERKVILFLTGTFLIGAGIRLYQETFPVTQQIEYQASDSTFAALSEAIGAAEIPDDETSSGLLDVNKATKQQLMELPGIGEVLANRILEYRERVGRFRTLDDLQNVKGISGKKFDQLKHLIIVH